MKGNNGRAARRTLLSRIAKILAFFTSLIVTLHMMGAGNRNGWSRPSLLRQSNTPTKTKPKLKTISGDDDEVYLIMSAYVTLVDITHDPDTTFKAQGDDYDGVYGEFCRVNFDIHKKQPSSVPMFRDVIRESPDCAKKRYKMNLNEAVRMAREVDADVVKKGVSSVPKSLPLAAAVFHESRCGSTLVANALIAMDPVRHRVYSESPPPIKAMTKVCGSGFDKCSIETAAAILRDVVYMMGRTDRTEEQRLFLKMQSFATHGINIFHKAFPTTPWLFVYREPVEVLMSHLKQGKNAICLKGMKNPTPAIVSYLERHGRTPENKEDFCAAHLATICEAAQSALEKSENGTPINYKDLPSILYTEIIPKRFGIPLNKEEIDRIKSVASLYSKGRDNRAGEWHEDSHRKEQQASKAVHKAAETFLQYNYVKFGEEHVQHVKTEDESEDVEEESENGHDDIL